MRRDKIAQVREGQREREREREKERENPKQASHSAQSPTRGLIPWPWDHDLNRNQESDSQPTEPPRYPKTLYLYLFAFVVNFLPNVIHNKKYEFEVWLCYYLVTWKFDHPTSYAFIHNNDKISADWEYSVSRNEKCPSKLNTTLSEDSFLMVW